MRSDEWEKKLIGHTVSNFFAAIWRGKLEVKIDKYEINKDNLIDMINNQAIEEALATEHDKDKTTIKNSRFYLDCRNPKHEGEIDVLQIQEM